MPPVGRTETMMKKLAVIILAIAMIVSTFVACTAEKNDLTSLNNYTPPSYEHKTENGTYTFAHGVGDTAIITKYSGKHESHVAEIPEKVGEEGSERTVVGIGESAFYFNSSITGVKIPETVTSIGNWAFANCTALESIELPAELLTIGKGAFNGCTALSAVTFKGTELRSIGDYAFNDCSALASFTLTEGLKSIGIQAFRDCTALTSIVCPSTLETIGNMAFYNCQGLDTPGALVLSASITEIGEYAFGSINKLNIVAPEGSYAAEYVANMRDVEENELPTEGTETEETTEAVVDETTETESETETATESETTVETTEVTEAETTEDTVVETTEVETTEAETTEEVASESIKAE